MDKSESLTPLCMCVCVGRGGGGGGGVIQTFDVTSIT